MRQRRAAAAVMALAAMAGAAHWVGSAGAAVSSPVRKAANGPSAPSQCAAGEVVLYSCQFGKSVGSVCGTAQGVHYRYGPLGKPDLDLSNRGDWGNVHTGYVRGQGAGGYQEHVRFTNGTVDYLVFRGEDGALASHPGRVYSGIAIIGAAKGERALACRGPALLAGSLSEAVAVRAPKDARLDEDEGGPFDGWF